MAFYWEVKKAARKPINQSSRVGTMHEITIQTKSFRVGGNDGKERKGNGDVKICVPLTSQGRKPFFLAQGNDRLHDGTFDLSKTSLVWKDDVGLLSVDGLRIVMDLGPFESLKVQFNLKLLNQDLKLSIEGIKGASTPSGVSAATHSNNKSSSAASSGHATSGSRFGSSDSRGGWHEDEIGFPASPPPPAPFKNILKPLTHKTESKASTTSLSSLGLSRNSTQNSNPNPTAGFANANGGSQTSKPRSAALLSLMDSRKRAQFVIKNAQPKSSSNGSNSAEKGTSKVALLPASRGPTHMVYAVNSQQQNCNSRPNSCVLSKSSSSSLYKRSRGGSSSSSAFFGSHSSTAFVPSSTPSSVIPGYRLEGMTNLGNTCYMGAVAQALLALPGLVEDLMSPFWEEGAMNSSSIINDVEKRKKATTCLRELAALVATRKLNMSAKGQPSNLTQLKRAVESHSSQFQGCSQQDAHEFLCTLMDAVHDEGVAYLKEISATLPITPAHTLTMDVSGDSGCRSVESTKSGVTEVVQGSSARSLATFRSPEEAKYGEDDAFGHSMPLDALGEAEIGSGPSKNKVWTAKRQRVGEGAEDAHYALAPKTPGEATSAGFPATPNASISDQLPNLLPTLRNMHAAVKVTLKCVVCGKLSDPRCTNCHTHFGIH